MMRNFTYTGSPSRVVFGSNTINTLATETSRLNITSPLILSSPRQHVQVKALEETLGGKIAGNFTEAAMHTPVHVTEKALAFAKSVGADSVISIGGGSTIGLGKAISIRTGLPHVCIPTTYSGSEMTPLLGETSNGVKKTTCDPKILPGTVVYDVNLTMSLPPALSATSGVNAIAHAVEALYAQNTNPIINLLALEGIKALAEALPIIVNSPSDTAARTSALYGAWLCGACLGSVGMALHHKLCHTIGGSFNMPHAETHSIILPHALSYNAPAIPDVMKKLAEVFPESNGDAIHGLNVLLTNLKIKRALKDYGFREENIENAADLAILNPYYNPRPVEKGPIQELIRRAFEGEDARADF